jgi:hypothetical protein
MNHGRRYVSIIAIRRPSGVFLCSNCVDVTAFASGYVWSDKVLSPPVCCALCAKPIRAFALNTVERRLAQ